MGKVKIKRPKPGHDSQLALLRILSKHHVFATKIVTAHDDFYVVTSQDSEVDVICNPPCHDAFLVQRFQSILPPDLKARRTVLLFRVASFIKDHFEDDIRTEDERLNEFALSAVDLVYKFPMNQIIKITFKRLKWHRKHCLKMFNMRIPPHDMQ